jgi:hypothetical protein
MVENVKYGREPRAAPKNETNVGAVRELLLKKKGPTFVQLLSSIPVRSALPEVPAIRPFFTGSNGVTMMRLLSQEGDGTGNNGEQGRDTGRRGAGGDGGDGGDAEIVCRQ